MYFAAIAQQVERILGKDEVPSSNLGSSSTRKTLVSAVFRDFSFSAHFAANRKRIEQRIELPQKLGTNKHEDDLSRPENGAAFFMPLVL